MARSNRQNRVATPSRTTLIPLNDDNAEKAERAKERSLLQSIQKQKMMAAASPGARRQTIASDGSSPRTPRNVGSSQREGTIDTVTPLRKVPILANFEEWMKMATDNKINATNSWNFALIDYFHDMSLLKEGDSVNFQKASCTLDGCVKIYTNRVDSVATETGKLLSGLADSSASKKKGRNGGEEGEGSDGEEGDADEEGRRKPKRRAQRSSETTLAKDFSQLQVKRLELEFSVDPLFKKASADFDEGGAKGLLLNHLSIDTNGRIVFDSSDDREEEGRAVKDGEDVQDQPPDYPEEPPEDPACVLNKLASLRNQFFPQLSKLDTQDICPTLKNVDFSAPGTLDIPFIKPTEERDDGLDPAAPSNAGANDDLDNGDGDGDGGGGGGGGDGGGGGGGDGNDMAYGFDDGYGIGADDGDITIAFGEGGEVWANETLVDGPQRLLASSAGPPLGLRASSEEGADFDSGENRYNPFGNAHPDILSYFDGALQKNWAGPEHWRIRRIKDSSKPAHAPVRVRREKEEFEIDFLNPGADVLDEVLAPPRSAHTINLARKDRISKTRNILPDDKHFNSRQLVRLYLKPKASYGPRRSNNTGTGGAGQALEPPENPDEEFWAKENMAGEIEASSTPAPKANYDANFFNDDNLDLPAEIGDDDDDDEAFADAREAFSPGLHGAEDGGAASQAVPSSQFPATQTIDFGTQPVTQNRRVRPEYMQYARVAKKVDVRKLKENIWTGLKLEGEGQPSPAAASGAIDMPEPSAPPAPTPEEPRKFTQIINDLRSVYPEKTMGDISTSYCFICLLHLANEKGLVVEEEGGELQELIIKKDQTATEPDAF